MWPPADVVGRSGLFSALLPLDRLETFNRMLLKLLCGSLLSPPGAVQQQQRGLSS